MLVKSNEPDLLSEFISHYRDEFESLGSRIESRNPDIIVAVSRSGPRLLEVLSQADVFTPSVPVVTEKALDFIEKRNA
jgi:hypothetical protein